MILVMIDNKQLLCKIISYFDKTKIRYTTDLNDNYEYILLSELNRKNELLIKENVKRKKKIIFITYLEEYRIIESYNSTSKQNVSYKEKLYDCLELCYLIIVSLPFFKKFLTKKLKNNIKIIEREVKFTKPIKNKKTTRKTILCVDPDYENINSIIKLAIKYPQYSFNILGLVPNYKLGIRTKELLRNRPNNIGLLKRYDKETYLHFCQISFMVLYFDQNINNIEYLIKIFMIKKPVMIKKSIWQEGYLINSKNAYLFSNFEELNIKLKKLFNNRIGNLSNAAFDLTKNNTFDTICIKFSKYLQ